VVDEAHQNTDEVKRRPKQMTHKRTLNGHVAAITGAARGIGKATAQACAREGMAVAIGDIDLEQAEKTATEIGNGAIALKLDVTDRASFASFLDTTEARLGPLDVLVNNAGIMLVGPPTWEEADDKVQRQIAINVNGVLHGIKEAVPRFRARGTGHLVNIASGAGKIGFAGGATYCGSKHFVVGVSEVLRSELRDSGVDVSCVMPAIVNTELASGYRPLLGVRTVQPEDVAHAIVRALQRPRFDVYVPAELTVLSRARALMPQRGYEAILRITKLDQVLTNVDHAARVAYETRATKMSPR
jgi:NADP-dependent 3-hydroxy acid dehydrogenase YdfG